MPSLEQSFSGNVVTKPSVPERRKELKRLRDALDVLARVPQAAWLGVLTLDRKRFC